MPYPIIHRDRVKDEKVLEQAMDVCPTAVFEKKKGKVVVAKPKECIGCKACESVCENNEITVVD